MQLLAGAHILLLVPADGLQGVERLHQDEVDGHTPCEMGNANETVEVGKEKTKRRAAHHKALRVCDSPPSSKSNSNEATCNRPASSRLPPGRHTKFST